MAIPASVGVTNIPFLKTWDLTQSFRIPNRRKDSPNPKWVRVPQQRVATPIATLETIARQILTETRYRRSVAQFGAGSTTLAGEYSELPKFPPSRHFSPREL